MAAQAKRAWKHFIVFDGGKVSRLVFFRRENPVSVVDPDFRTGVDAVLPFPELDQPCSAAIVKIDRQGVEDHLEARCHIIIKPCVTGRFLPCIKRGREEAAAAVIGVTERLSKLF